MNRKQATELYEELALMIMNKSIAHADGFGVNTKELRRRIENTIANQVVKDSKEAWLLNIFPMAKDSFINKATAEDDLQPYHYMILYALDRYEDNSTHPEDDEYPAFVYLAQKGYVFMDDPEPEWGIDSFHILLTNKGRRALNEAHLDVGLERYKSVKRLVELSGPIDK